jgi:hypothetical protein
MIQSPLNHLLVLKISSHHFIPNSESVGFQSLGPGTGDTKMIEQARPEFPEQSWNLAGTFRCWVAKLGK